MTLRVIQTLTVFAVLLTLAAIGCAKRESSVRQSAGGSTSGREKPTEAAPPDSTTPVPPHIDGTAVGASDSLINAIAPMLEPWTNMLRQAMPDFAPDSLIRVGAAPAFRGYVQPLKGVYPPSEEKVSTFKILSARSPGGRYNLIFDWYLVIEESGDEVDISGEPDSAPLLLDLRRGTSNQLEECGSECRFDWGVWLSPTMFALAGMQAIDGSIGWRQGRIKIYSIADSTATTYVTRPVSNEGRYRSAWEAWVGERFRSSKPSHP